MIAIIKHPSIKGEIRDDCSFFVICFITIRGLHNMDQFNAGATLTSLMVNMFSKQLRESWLEHTEDTKQVPDVDKLIKFLDRKIQARSSTAETAPVKPLPKSDIKSRQFSALPSLQATATSKLCNGDKHPLYSFLAHKDMSVSQRSVHIMNRKCCIVTYYIQVGTSTTTYVPCLSQG